MERPILREPNLLPQFVVGVFNVPVQYHYTNTNTNKSIPIHQYQKKYINTNERSRGRRGGVEGSHIVLSNYGCCGQDAAELLATS